MALTEAQKANGRRFYAANRERLKTEKREAQTIRRAARKQDPELVAQDRERSITKNKRWRTRHPEEAKASVAKWRAANPDVQNTARRRRYAEDPAPIIARENTRRAQKARAPGNDLTAAQWRAMKTHYGHRCIYCGKKPKTLAQDHITPLSKGGAHTLHNVVPACKSCNSRKGTGGVLKPIQPLLLI